MQQSRGQKLLYLAVFIILAGSLAFAIANSRDTKKTSHVAQASGKSKSVTTTSSPTTPSQIAAGTNNANLSNTGPAETVTIFVMSAAGGTAAAHMYQRRRLRSQNIA